MDYFNGGNLNCTFSLCQGRLDSHINQKQGDQSNAKFLNLIKLLSYQNKTPKWLNCPQLNLNYIFLGGRIQKFLLEASKPSWNIDISYLTSLTSSGPSATCKNNQAKEKETYCQEWDSNPRLHSETRTPAPIVSGKVFNLESGALDRSAILTTAQLGELRWCY